MRANLKKAWRVEVEWVDSQLIADGWISQKRARLPDDAPVCHSVGFLLEDTDQRVAVASSVNGRNVFGVVVIPRRQVRSMVRLES